jgi:hypothetical protein
MPDGLLLHLRDTYPIETAWAPPWVGDQLRQVRAGARDARLAALRATAEAGLARRDGKRKQAGQQEALAASYQAMHHAYRQQETAFAATMADRTEWERATRHQRQLAVSADAELRRRHPDQRWPPLRSDEPRLGDLAHNANADPTRAQNTEEAEQRTRELAAQHREFAGKLAERQSLTIPAEVPDYQAFSQALPVWAQPERDAILQPPKPQIRPSERILERTADRDLHREAAD